MPNEEYQLLFDSMGEQLFQNGSIVAERNQPEISRMLIKETLRFRDKLKEDIGYTLTVEDARIALNAFETHFIDEKFPKDITSEQKALAKILIDTVVLYKYGL